METFFSDACSLNLHFCNFVTLDNAIFLLILQILLYSVCLLTAKHNQSKHIYNAILWSCKIQASTGSNFYSLENDVNYSGSKTGILVVLDEFRYIIYIYANVLFIEN